jgi:hypothetical protein
VDRRTLFEQLQINAVKMALKAVWGLLKRLRLFLVCILLVYCNHFCHGASQYSDISVADDHEVVYNATTDDHVSTDDHESSTDDHETSSHEGSGGVFGSLYYINVRTGSICIIIIIFAVYLVESLFHELHRYTDDTPFQDMIAGLEKELMIVGCMAFIFKVIISNSQDITQEWLHALEYADTVVPFVSFCFCAQGMFLILVSIHYCNSWSKAYHLLPEELELDYFDLVSGSRWSFWNYMKREQLRGELEFKIIHELFCVQFRIKRFSIPFDVYVERIFEKYLLETITIAPMDWAVVCVLALGDWCRKALKVDYPSSGPNSCPEYDVECSELHDLILFTFAGCIMFLVTLILAVQSRYYEKKLLATVGVGSLKEYIQYLAACEKIIHEPKRQKFFGVEDVKENLRKVRDERQSAEEEGSVIVHYLVFILIMFGSFAVKILTMLFHAILKCCGDSKPDKTLTYEDEFSSKSRRNSSGSSRPSREEEHRLRAELSRQASFKKSFRGPLQIEVEQPVVEEGKKFNPNNSREQEFRARVQKSLSLRNFVDKKNPNQSAASSSKIFPGTTTTNQEDEFDIPHRDRHSSEYCKLLACRDDTL